MQGLTKEFYDFCKRHELHFQRCKACGSWRHVPREMCAECGSMEWEWAKSSGKGTVYTWTVAVRAMHPAFQAEVPYAPVVIEMDEGVRLLSTVLDVAPEDLRVGMPVEVVFQDVTDEIALPKFRRQVSRAHLG
jgi:hypothetical protein